MRAIVIGSGIAGLTTAIALRRVGFNVTVYERAAELTEAGAGISLSAVVDHEKCQPEGWTPTKTTGGRRRLPVAHKKWTSLGKPRERGVFHFVAARRQPSGASWLMQ